MKRIHNEDSPCEETIPGTGRGAGHAYEGPQPDDNYETGEDPPTAA
jgi:hypothetical protein